VPESSANGSSSRARTPIICTYIILSYTSRPGNPAAAVPREITFDSGPVRGRGKKPLNRFYNNIILLLYIILLCTSYRRRRRRRSRPLPDWGLVYLYKYAHLLCVPT